MINIFQDFPEAGTYISSKSIIFRARQNWKENPEIEENVNNLEDQYSLKQAFFLAQTHSSDVAIIGEDTLKEIVFADACITTLEDVSLNVVVADCVPIIIYDRKNKAIGVVHAGWKGASEKILSKTLQSFQEEFHSQREDLFLFFGPSICQNCYEVGEEVAELFHDKFLKSSQNPGKYFLDVKASNLSEAFHFGIPEINIEVSQECTLELPERYFSYRRTRKKENFVVGIYKKSFDKN